MKQRICSNDNTNLMKNAFQRLRQFQNTTVPPFNILHDEVIPQMIWRPLNTTETRQYVTNMHEGTSIQKYATPVILLMVLTLLSFSFRLSHWIRGVKYIYHGTSDSDARVMILEAIHRERDPGDEGNIISTFYCPLYSGVLEVMVTRFDGLEHERFSFRRVNRDAQANDKMCPLCRPAYG